MADDDQGAAVFHQFLFQHLEHFNVEVIGGLVQYHQVVGLSEQLGQQNTIHLAARQVFDRGARPLRREQETFEVADHVPVATVHGDVIFAVGHVEGHAFVPLQTVPHLVKVTDGQIGADFYRADVRLQLTEQNPQQRSLSHAVVTNDADAIAAHDFELKVVE